LFAKPLVPVPLDVSKVTGYVTDILGIMTGFAERIHF
jgi:hypothetical protein